MKKSLIALSFLCFAITGSIVKAQSIEKPVIVEKKTEPKKQPPKKKQILQTGVIILQPKQTFYSITKQYNISEKEIRQLNPNLESKKEGDEIILPLENIKKYQEK